MKQLLRARCPSLLLLLLWLTPLGLGCSEGPERPEVHPVTGTLTVNGEPAEGALLSLHPIDGQDFDARGSRPWATVEADGSFAVSTYGSEDGAPVGEYAVSVLWSKNANSSNPVDQLGGRFANPKESQWRVQIVEGVNALEPYAIDGVGIPRGGRQDEPSNSIDPPE